MKPDLRQGLPGRLGWFSWGRSAAWAALVAVLLLSLAPLWVMLKTALTDPLTVYQQSSALWPEAPTLLNFRRVLGGTTLEQSLAVGGSGAQVDFAAALVHSLVFTALVAGLQTASCAMAAYAFARLRFAGRGALFAAFLGTMMLPSVILFIPNFVLIKQLGWLNSMAGVVAPFALMSGSSVFILRQFFLSLPRDLEEAALLDGASPLGIFFRIVVPLSVTPLTMVATLTGLNAWNEFFWPYIAAPSEEFRVLPTMLQSFRSQTPQGQVDWTGLMAAATLAALPTIALLVVLGRRVVESIQFTGGR